MNIFELSQEDFQKWLEEDFAKTIQKEFLDVPKEECYKRLVNYGFIKEKEDYRDEKNCMTGDCKNCECREKCIAAETEADQAFIDLGFSRYVDVYYNTFDKPAIKGYEYQMGSLFIYISLKHETVGIWHYDENDKYTNAILSFDEMRALNNKLEELGF